MKQVLYTAADEIEIYHKVKDSKFYGNIKSVNTEDKVKEFTNQIKNEYEDASHNVSAYKLGSGDKALKYYDDDGEPAGSSGPPVLQAIEGENLVNTVVVVTRYFGGTKLGIGGLIRAYGNTARMAIKEAGTKKLNLTYRIMISVDYNFIGTTMGQIESARGNILETKYSNNGMSVTFLIKPHKYDSLTTKLIEKTSNNIDINKLEELYL